jgi:F0F1-type ATP synthase epsilon subunit
MSKQIDISQELSDFDRQYLTDRGLTHLLDENARLLMEGASEAQAKEDAEAAAKAKAAADKKAADDEAAKKKAAEKAAASKADDKTGA